MREWVIGIAGVILVGAGFFWWLAVQYGCYSTNVAPSMAMQAGGRTGETNAVLSGRLPGTGREGEDAFSQTHLIQMAAPAGATALVRETPPTSGGAPGSSAERVDGAQTTSVVNATVVAQYRAEPNAILRREALLKWSQENQPGVDEVVQIAVTDADPSVILQALEILGRRGDKSSAPLLARVIRDNAIRPDGYGMPIREMAIRALGTCGGGGNVPQLVAELERHEDLSYDNVVVESLGLIGHVSALDALNRQIRRLEQFKPGERMVREVVQRALEVTISARDRIIKRSGS